MDWIIVNLITNKRNNKLIYGILFGIIILDFLNDQVGFINEKYLIVDFSLYAIGLLIIKQILNYWYKSLYRENQTILDYIRKLSQTGNYAKIMEQAQLIKIIKPQITEKIYWTGFANLYLNNYEKALQYFDSIESEYGDSSGFLYNKGLALIDSGDNEKAIEYLARSIELERTWKNLDQRGVAYMHIDKFEEAENDLRESNKLKEESSNTCNLGVILDKQGRHEEALKFYTKSIELKSNNQNAFYNRGLANFYLKNYQDSIFDNTKAIELNPSRHWTYYNRALSRQKINEFKLAIEDYDSAEYYGNNDKYLYLNRGYCKCESGEITNGLTDLIKAMDMDCKEAKVMIEKYNKQ
jgi:tetratricopeptide (TPR) repeat protein